MENEDPNTLAARMEVWSQQVQTAWHDVPSIARVVERVRLRVSVDGWNGSPNDVGGRPQAWGGELRIGMRVSKKGNERREKTRNSVRCKLPA